MEPLRFTDHHGDDKNISMYRQTSKEAKEKIAPATQSFRLGDKLKIEKPIRNSHASVDNEINHNISERTVFPVQFSGGLQKQSFDRKGAKDDELVKHMSKLPSYLQHVEKEENLQKKVLNFGVLDWQRVEKWKYSEKQVPCRPRRYSSSTSNTSSPFSTIGSSTMSTGSDSGMLAHPRKEISSLSSHLTTSSNEIRTRSGKSLRGKSAAVQDFKAPPVKGSIRQQNIRGIDVTKGSTIKLEKGSERSTGTRIVTEIQSSLRSENSEAVFCSKGKMKTSEDEFTHKTNKFQEFTLPDQSSGGRNKTIVLLLPRSSSTKRCSGPIKQSELEDGKLTAEANCRRSSGSNLANDVQFAELNPPIPHSSPLSCEIEGSKHSDVGLPSKESDIRQRPESTRFKGKSTSLKCRRFSDSNFANYIPSAELNSDVPHSGSLSCGIESLKQPKMNSLRTVDARNPKFLSDSADMPSFQTKDKSVKDTTTSKPTKVVLVEPALGLGLKATEAAAAKSRNASPSRRPNVGLSGMSRSSSIKEGSALPLLSPTYITAKSGPVVSDSSAENSNKEKVSTNSRAKSSPLRRLLDPLLKPKSANRVNATVSFQDESSPTQGISEPCHESSVSQAVKRGLDFSNCTPTNSEGLHQDEKHRTSTVPALLQVTVRNGLPWFTFAVNKNKDVLAATMKKISICGKYDCSWMYTFYSFHQVAKKSGGWISQGSKVKSREYVPNVVGEMKVTSAQCSTKHRNKDQCMVREFILFGNQPGQAGEDTRHFEHKSELAAVIVKVPREATGTSPSGGFENDNSADSSKMKLSDFLPEETSCSSSPSTVVLLPSGFHGLPASGRPSPLIHRWRSGGICDCGGWDVGCKLRVLSNQEEELSESSCKSKAFTAPEQFHLFVEEGVKEHKPFFSLTTYKKGIYSVDFNTSISSLQAFSICIAFLHSRNLADLPETGNLLGETTSSEPITMKTNSMKDATSIDWTSISNSASFPPHSPFARV